MRFLITSGGTQVAIDPVRHIANASTGRFGSQLTVAALEREAEVVYLTSANGVSPFSQSIDFYATPDWERNLHQLEWQYQFCQKYRDHYHEFRYQTYAGYASSLKSLIQSKQPDIIILSAAVSDYLVTNYSEDKIRSNTNLTIQLEAAPKLIHSVKEWSNTAFVVGFKLLIDASDNELVSAAMRIMHEHGLDMVVANNLSSLQKGAHEVILVERNGSFQKFTQDLAPNIIASILTKVYQ